MELQTVDHFGRALLGARDPLGHLWDDSQDLPRLRIAVVAPPWYEVPPPAYGGIEWVCSLLVQGLVARGHDVTLVAAGRDLTDARMIATFDEPPEGLGDVGGSTVELLHAARATAILADLRPDVVHDHSLAGPLMAGTRRTRTVITAHGPVGGAVGDLYTSLPSNVSLVAISDAQRRTAPRLPWAATIHNAIPVEEYPLSLERGEFVLFLGRMSPDKGAHLAIDAAREVGIRIVVGGKCQEPVEREYFAAEIEPRLGPDVEWIGEADTQEKKDLYARARCLLVPIQWEEPFGLVMVEAMACGTPVVALRRGSVPELVVDGETGFIYEDPSGLAEGIKRADLIDPRACRRHVEERFHPRAMVAAYERVYASLSLAGAAPAR
jgi:glycosyltransferase involved in cell wall biosynthesis